MCKASEVEEIVSRINREQDIRRDKNLDKKFNKLRQDVLDHTSKLMQHIKTSPETKEIINKFEKNCMLSRGKFSETNIKMQNDIENIKKILKEDRAWKEKLEIKLEASYAKKEEVDEIKESLSKTTAKNDKDIEKLKKFMWQITAVCGALIWLWSNVGKDFFDHLEK